MVKERVATGETRPRSRADAAPQPPLSTGTGTQTESPEQELEKEKERIPLGSEVAGLDLATGTGTATPTLPKPRLNSHSSADTYQTAPRHSPDPLPQPRRFTLKFKRELLEQTQRKEAAEREKVARLLEEQREEAFSARDLLTERDLEMVPSLEGPLSLRSGRSRRDREGRVGRPRARKGSLCGNGIGVRKKSHPNSKDVGEVQIPLQEQVPEITKPVKPKKMELELRIDDRSTEKDKEALERNIDNVVYGDVKFKAWYPSWYPKEIIGEKALTVGGGDKGGIVVSELYVCKRCFGYGKVLVEWLRHCRYCEKKVPGRKMYVHGGWREEGAPRGANGEWSIWEVDGAVETLFCQKLSLFAKLFLDNKSVFFDVSGFNYFLLVFTPSPLSPHNPDSPPQPQIIGFFSKEKMSWDNNNLACILIFPPWQRRGLGALLMGVSYAIARREGIMGGPEKPISELGMKGYKRYWSAEVARWLLGRPEARQGKKGKREEVSVEVCSRETWIAADDCLGVLRDMGIVERVGREKNSESEEGGPKEKEKEVIRVRFDKADVRQWCERMGIKLERVVSEDGFRPGYAGQEDSEEEEAEEGQEMV
ncbi:MOZ/SAS family protein [Diplocarpon rosae]|nr:MOZ/SAS family protein [Diplocarpon rosae]